MSLDELKAKRESIRSGIIFIIWLIVWVDLILLFFVMRACA